MRSKRPVTIRSDALRSRGAILEAARELFAVTSDVPMYEVAKRAGVGQATLYRHFPDRVALASTLAEEVVVSLEALSLRHADDPDAFHVLFRGVVDAMVTFRGLIDFMRGPATMPTTTADRLKERLLGLFDGPLRRARASSTVRENVQIDDVLVVLAMISGGLGEVHEPADRPVVAERMIDIILDGITPPR